MEARGAAATVGVMVAATAAAMAVEEMAVVWAVVAREVALVVEETGAAMEAERVAEARAAEVWAVAATEAAATAAGATAR